MKIKLLTPFITLALVLSIGTMAVANDHVHSKSASDSLILKPFLLPRKNIVKVSPNPSSNGKVCISSTVEDDLHFYVFDLEATLIYRITLNGKDKKIIPDLKKGIYTYDVFKNDESIEQGTITVK